jgi:hypothetical protein
MLTPEQEERVAEWVRDLRANGDKQGKFYLRTAEDKFCCLGRVCLLAEKAGVPMQMRLRNAALWCDTSKSVVYEYFESTGSLDDVLTSWLGLASSDGRYTDENGERCSLFKDNDARDYTFEMIADIIESRPEGLFV